MEDAAAHEPTRVLVVGGDAAGMSAASHAQRLAGDRLRITAVERGPRTSWSACGLPYLVEGSVASPDDLIARTPAQFEQRGIAVHVGHEVTALELSERTATVRDLTTGAERELEWDELVLGTGARGIVPPLPGVEAVGVQQLRTVEDALALDRRIEEGARRAVVVGAGYIGVEVAEALVRRGLEVSVLELADEPMAGTLDADMASLVSDAMSSAGVQLHFGDGVEGFEQRDGRLSGVRAGGRTVAADVAVLALGARPEVALAEAAGVPLGSTGAIAVDDTQRTGVEHVWAAGDCVESHHRVLGRPAVVALGTHANRQGRVIGTNLAGGSSRFPGVIGTAITRFIELEIARTGLTEREATAEGVEVEVTTADSSTRSGYYPGAAPVRVRLVARRADAVVIGAQVVGGPGAGKRIDALAMAVWTQMTVDELAGVDLSYAPPFSPVFDPVSITARRAAETRSAS